MEVLVIMNPVKSWDLWVIKPFVSLARSGGGQQQNLRHEAGGGVFRVTRKTDSFTIVLLGGHLEDLTN